MTDTLTPGLRVVRSLTGERADLDRAGGGADSGQRRPRRLTALLPVVADLAIAYFWLSQRPYDLWGVLTPFVVFAGVLRLGFSHFLDG